MSASAETLQVRRVAHAARRRALALVIVLVATLWGSGFATGRLTTRPDQVSILGGPPALGRLAGAAPAGLALAQVRPGTSRGAVKSRPASADLRPSIRPGDHDGGIVKDG